MSLPTTGEECKLAARLGVREAEGPEEPEGWGGTSAGTKDQQRPKEGGLRMVLEMGPGVGVCMWAGGGGSEMHECLDPRSRERSCGSQDRTRDNLGRGPASWLCVERPSQAGGPPWSPYSQALLCPELVPGGARAGLAARPETPQLRTQKNHRLICQKTEQGLWSCLQLKKMRDIGLTPGSPGHWFDTWWPLPFPECTPGGSRETAAPSPGAPKPCAKAHDRGREGPSVPLPSQHIPCPCWGGGGALKTCFSEPRPRPGTHGAALLYPSPSGCHCLQTSPDRTKSCQHTHRVFKHPWEPCPR